MCFRWEACTDFTILLFCTLLNFVVGWIFSSFAYKGLPLSSILLEVYDMLVAATGIVVFNQCIINVFSGYSCVYVCFVCFFFTQM